MPISARSAASKSHFPRTSEHASRSFGRIQDLRLPLARVALADRSACRHCRVTRLGNRRGSAQHPYPRLRPAATPLDRLDHPSTDVAPRNVALAPPGAASAAERPRLGTRALSQHPIVTVSAVYRHAPFRVLECSGGGSCGQRLRPRLNPAIDTRERSVLADRNRGPPRRAIPHLFIRGSTRRRRPAPRPPPARRHLGAYVAGAPHQQDLRQPNSATTRPSRLWKNSRASAILLETRSF